MFEMYCWLQLLAEFLLIFQIVLLTVHIANLSNYFCPLLASHIRTQQQNKPEEEEKENGADQKPNDQHAQSSGADEGDESD